jgi:hypothetical protein
MNMHMDMDIYIFESKIVDIGYQIALILVSSDIGLDNTHKYRSNQHYLLRPANLLYVGSPLKALAFPTGCSSLSQFQFSRVVDTSLHTVDGINNI